MPSGAFTGARHISFSDTVLATGAGIQDFTTLRNGQDFRPQATFVNTSSDAGQQTEGYAVIDGYLFGENENYRALYNVSLRQPIGLAFRAIYSSGTTARGIKLISEV